MVGFCGFLSTVGGCASQSDFGEGVGLLGASLGSGLMSPFLRKVTTASGATVVQIVEKKHG